MEISPPMPLSVQQTACAEQVPEPTPTTVRGEQVIPTRPVKSPTTIPRRPSSNEVTGSKSLAASVLLQHWIGPVLQVLDPLCGTGVATARVARAAVMKANLNCMSSRLEST